MKQFLLAENISVIFDKNFPWKDNWMENLKDLKKEFKSEFEEKGDFELIIKYKKPVGENLTEVSHNLLVDCDSILDLEKSARIFFDQRQIILETDRPSFEILIWLLQLSLLQVGCTFIHGAAVEKDDRVLAFPSWGGVGKTALVNFFVKNEGFKLLGDDLFILNQEGKCFPYPKRLVLYSYHKKIFPESFAKSNRKFLVPPFLLRNSNSLIRKIKPFIGKYPKLMNYLRLHDPQSIKIPPSKVFGKDKVLGEGNYKLEGIFWLNKDSQAKVIRKKQIFQISSRIFGSTLNEFDLRCLKMLNIALGAGLIKETDTFLAWHKILNKGLEKVPKFLIDIPIGVKIEDIGKEIFDKIKKGKRDN